MIIPPQLVAWLVRRMLARALNRVIWAATGKAMKALLKKYAPQIIRIVARYAAGALGAIAIFKGVEAAMLETAVATVLLAVSEIWFAVDATKQKT